MGKMEENASSPLKRDMIKTPLVGTGLNCRYRPVNPYPSRKISG